MKSRILTDKPKFVLYFFFFFCLLGKEYHNVLEIHRCLNAYCKAVEIVYFNLYLGYH